VADVLDEGKSKMSGEKSDAGLYATADECAAADGAWCCAGAIGSEAIVPASVRLGTSDGARADNGEDKGRDGARSLIVADTQHVTGPCPGAPDRQSVGSGLLYLHRRTIHPSASSRHPWLRIVERARELGKTVQIYIGISKRHPVGGEFLVRVHACLLTRRVERR
jgi:hypothetical protein